MELSKEEEKKKVNQDGSVRGVDGNNANKENDDNGTETTVPGKNKVVFKRADMVENIANRNNGDLCPPPSKRAPEVKRTATSKTEKINIFLNDIKEFFSQEEMYNMPNDYYMHSIKLLGDRYYDAYDMVVYFAVSYELPEAVRLHGLHLFHRLINMCQLKTPMSRNGVVNEEVKRQFIPYVLVCLSIAQKYYCRVSSFTFTKIVPTLYRYIKISTDDLRRKEFSVLDALDWHVTPPDIMRYRNMLLQMKVLDAQQVELLTTLVEMCLFYPRLITYEQRDLIKACLFIVLAYKCKEPESRLYYEMIAEGSTRLKRCIFDILNKWNPTYSNGLHISQAHEVTLKSINPLNKEPFAWLIQSDAQ